MPDIQTLATLFADISGSTQLYETLGDAKARAVTSRCVQMMAEVTEQMSGRVIKTIGDEVMCTFPTAAKAGEAAILMQEAVRDRVDEIGAELSIRVGFHLGEVIEEGGDVFGDAVNLAARMAAQAKADQIITTGESVAELDPQMAENTRMLITTRVKGKQKPVEVHELIWGETSEVTTFGGMPAGGVAGPAPVQAHIRFQDVDLLLNSGLSTVNMGRGAQNQVVTADVMASRLHARIELRRGRVMLVDQSTNGTYVLDREGQQRMLHRDEMVLEGEGVIGLGKAVTPEMPEAVFFLVQ